MKIGIDASALATEHTGLGNYILPILDALQRTQPHLRFFLYSNGPLNLPSSAAVTLRISRPKRRGPLWQNTQLMQMLHEDHPEVFWGASGFLPVKTPRSTATVVTIYDMVYRFAPHTLPFISRWGRRLFQPIAARQADRIVAISEATAKDVSTYYRRTPDAVVPPVIDSSFSHRSISQRAITVAKLNLPPRYLLSLGTIEPRKNLALLIKAYLDRRKIHTSLPTLIIAGKPGWLNAEITQLVALGVEQGLIRQLGYVNKQDLPSLYAACDAFLMPSVYEGYGMPILEAQLSGAPVIHGPHASMGEASGQLGVVCGTDYTSLCQLFDALAVNHLPLTCRLPSTYQWSAELAADIMMKQFEQACLTGQHSGSCSK